MKLKTAVETTNFGTWHCLLNLKNCLLNLIKPLLEDEELEKNVLVKLEFYV